MLLTSRSKGRMRGGEALKTYRLRANPRPQSWVSPPGQCPEWMLLGWISKQMDETSFLEMLNQVLLIISKQLP